MRIAGTFREHVFNITNQGDDNLFILGVAFTGRNIADFQIVGDPSGTIAPGASALLRIRFDPSTIGGKRAIVNIFSSDLDEARYTFAIVGRGVRGPGIGRPEIAVTGSLAIFDGDFTPRPEDGTDFGVTTVGQTTERTFYITNIGGGLLQFESPIIRIGGRNPLRFTIVDMPDDLSLSAGETTSFTVRFTALTPGSKRANIEIRTNDLDESSFEFQIRGRGYP